MCDLKWRQCCLQLFLLGMLLRPSMHKIAHYGAIPHSWTRWCAHSPRARYPGMWSQVGLRKHHYQQSQWKRWNSSWAISNAKRWCYESAALDMPANLENSTVATGVEKVSFDSNPKERQCQRMLKLLHIALISHTSKVMLKFSNPGFNNTWTVKFQMFKLVLEKAEEPEVKLPTSYGSSKKQESSRKTSVSILSTMPKPLTV